MVATGSCLEQQRRARLTMPLAIQSATSRRRSGSSCGLLSRQNALASSSTSAFLTDAGWRGGCGGPRRGRARAVAEPIDERLERLPARAILRFEFAQLRLRASHDELGKRRGVRAQARAKRLERRGERGSLGDRMSRMGRRHRRECSTVQHRPTCPRWQDVGDATTPEERERRPAIVAVDDEPAVLAAVARDLRRAFAERYRILRAPSGAEALEILRQLRTRGDQVALLIADQRMPGMSGTEYLVEARKIVPDAKRVLLTAYADTEAAIAAINEVALDYYLLKPWDPPEEQLYPVVEDLLTTWESGAALEAGGAARHRPPLLEGLPRPARLPRAQPRPGALAGRRARRRGARAAARRRRRRRPPARRAARGRRRARAPDRARARRAPRRQRGAVVQTTTTSSSSAAARPGSPPRSTARPRACGRS